MNFNEWWATLTPVEQKVIGRTNAKFVWMEACEIEREACAKVCENSVEYAGDTLAQAIRARGQA